MEQRGKIQQQNNIAIIPARVFSTRLPNKLLLPIAGKPLIIWTLEQAKKARNISRVIIATDSEEILRVVKENGDKAVLTSKAHQSGSDRIAEVAETLPENSIIVNVQGDEPLISPTTIEKAVDALLQNDSIQMATTCEPIDNINDILSSDVVKVVTDENDFALYFSRSPIPFPRDSVKKHGSLENALRREPDLIKFFRKHTGLYVYRREFLLNYTKLKQTNLEEAEMLEQLRALENGAKIKVVEVLESSIGVDTQEDFERVRNIIEANEENIFEKYIVRKAEIEDVPQIARVHVESWQKSFRGIAPQTYLDNLSIERRENSFRKRFADKNYMIFVAETAQNRVVGFADCGKGRDEFSEYDGELYAIYLLSEFQRKGIGGKLLKKCAEALKLRNYNSMYLEALEVSPYRNFYEKSGGKIIGQSSDKLGNKVFAIIHYGWDDLNKI